MFVMMFLLCFERRRNSGCIYGAGTIAFTGPARPWRGRSVVNVPTPANFADHSKREGDYWQTIPHYPLHCISYMHMHPRQYSYLKSEEFNLLWGRLMLKYFLDGARFFKAVRSHELLFTDFAD
jgi:hypothetical protein